VAISGDWDRRISRRTLLKTGGSFAAGVALAGLASERAFAQASFGGYPFTLGVASGDPTPMGVVLWTRLAPDPLAVGGGLPAEPYEVAYEVSRDEDLRHIDRHGTTVALPEEAHSVRVELDGLPPERVYHYRFSAGGEISPVGRTRTGPPGNSMVDAVTFAFVSCQHFADGFFTPYADVASAADVEAVIFLGDYIYEGGAQGVRGHAPAKEIRTLDEYRIRHGQYKTGPDLQAAHAAHPWLVTWDDHEFKNNYAGLDLDPDVPIEQVRARRAAAYRAYWEHMPLARARKPEGPDLQLYRRFHWGQLATCNVLDGRQYRSDQPAVCADDRHPSGYCPADLSAERTMLGAEQRDWLLADLATTKARWNVLAQQTGFAPFNRAAPGAPPNFGVAGSTVGPDSWDGYVAERQRILDWIVEQRTPNPVVLTGDSHQNWVRNVPRDYRDLASAPVATEFMGTSISTNGDPPVKNLFTRYQDDPNNPRIVFRNNNRGYVRCTLTPDAWTSEYRKASTVTQPQATASPLATFVIEDGRAGAART
jgi:alkaline phosphatase D